jgi:uncharacterized iron-regulated membrane protein
MREKLLFIHRWLGLTGGVIFAILSVTGAVLIYEADLNRLIGSPRFESTPGVVDASVLEASIMREHPDGEIRGLLWLADANIVRANVRENNRSWRVFLDAGSGRIVQPREDNKVLELIHGVHASLLIGRIGSKVVTYASAAALASLAMGIYLWWPGFWKLWTGFRVRWSRSAYLLNLDLHRSLGILALPLLMMAAATGVLLSYGQVTDRIENVVHGPRPDVGWEDLRSALPKDSAATMSVATLVHLAHTGMPDAHLTSIKLPVSADGAAEARFERDGLDAVLVALDRHTGATLATRTETSTFRFDRAGVERLHMARVGGPVFRVLYTLSCVAGFALLPTGLVVWWIKRARKAVSTAERKTVSGSGF